MTVGPAQFIRDIAAPFAGDLHAEAGRLGWSTEIPVVEVGGRLLPIGRGAGPATASTTHDLVIGFFAFVAGGFSQELGKDVYENAVKQPVSRLLQRLHRGSDQAGSDPDPELSAPVVFDFVAEFHPQQSNVLVRVVVSAAGLDEASLGTAVGRGLEVAGAAVGGLHPDRGDGLTVLSVIVGPDGRAPRVDLTSYGLGPRPDPPAPPPDDVGGG